MINKVEAKEKKLNDQNSDGTIKSRNNATGQKWY